MDVLEAIRTKHSVRQFQDKPLPDEVVRAILEAGRRAPSSRNTQPWVFLAIRERERLVKMAEISVTAKHLTGAALGVVILTPDPSQSYHIMFDAGMAATYMMFAAWEQGVGSCVGSINGTEEARQFLGFPSDFHARICLSFGYSLEAPRPARKGGRKPFDEVVRWETWS